MAHYVYPQSMLNNNEKLTTNKLKGRFQDFTNECFSQ